MKKLKNFMKETRFLKRIVIFCISFITIFTIVSMYLNYKVGMELSPTLTSSVYMFFGTELCASMVVRITENLRRKTLEQEEEEKRNQEKNGIK